MGGPDASGQAGCVRVWEGSSDPLRREFRGFQFVGQGASSRSRGAPAIEARAACRQAPRRPQPEPPVAVRVVGRSPSRGSRWASSVVMRVIGCDGRRRSSRRSRCASSVKLCAVGRDARRRSRCEHKAPGPTRRPFWISHRGAALTQRSRVDSLGDERTGSTTKCLIQAIAIPESRRRKQPETSCFELAAANDSEKILPPAPSVIAPLPVTPLPMTPWCAP